MTEPIPADLVGRWVAAHPNGRLAFTVTAEDRVQVVAAGPHRSCSLCGEMIRRTSLSGHGGVLTCPRHTFPTGVNLSHAAGQAHAEMLTERDRSRT